MKIMFGFKGADLLPHGSVRASRAITKKDRECIKLAVIDDEIFEPRPQLKRLGYDTNELEDVKTIDEVVGFDIVLVDLMGVGMKFDTTNQGAFLIKEIKKNHPTVFICVYSGADNLSSIVAYAKQNADMFIRKDEDVDSIVEKLDELANRASSPNVVWSRLRESFVLQGVSTRDIMYLEHEYVSQFLSQNPKGDSLANMAQNLTISQTARDIIINLGSSYIFKALTGQ